ncbi:4'-phosphopantetheinyl transferase superfamily protein [Sphingomonas koreensis]|nr:4'-phosphopantetheinyl transferase superfamily protein [Sphingomonas koreensis]
MPRVELRIGALDLDADEVATLAALLDDAERDRAARFRFDRDRRRFVVRRARLRLWLGDLMAQAPGRVQFTTNAYGKPQVIDGPRFSLSHSRELMLLATSDTEIGCDVEAIDDALDWRPLADSLFAPAERAALAALPAPDARRGFFDCWARKEAFVKAIGQGLSYPLTDFTVSVGAEAALAAPEPGWSIAAVEVAPGYAAAVVARGGAVTIVRPA